MGRSKWKETLYSVYKTLEEESKKGAAEISVIRLAALTGYSPVYLSRFVLPSLAELFPCIKLEAGRVVFSCQGDKSG